MKLDQAAADHREAIDAVLRTLETVDPALWNQPSGPGKWSPAEVAQHLFLSYGPPTAELEGGQGFVVRVAWWKRPLLRWKVLPVILAGGFPRGAPAPRECRPRDAAPDSGEAIRRLREASTVFERRLCEAAGRERVRLTHAYFGKLTAPQILKLLASHAGHHRKQFPAPG